MSMRFWKLVRLLAPGAAALAFGGCFSSQQIFDFARTEVARLTADIVGRLVTLFQTATAGAA